MYDLIVAKTDGDARTIIKTVEEGNGLLAWKRLYREFGEVTATEYGIKMARLMDPKPCKTVKDMGSAIQAWEADVLRLNRESADHQLSRAVMRNILVEKFCACAPTLREHLRMRAAEYDTFEKAKVYAVDYARTTRVDSNAMDVGELQYNETMDEERAKDGSRSSTTWAREEAASGGTRGRARVPKATAKGKGKGKSGTFSGARFNCGEQ